MSRWIRRRKSNLSADSEKQNGKNVIGHIYTYNEKMSVEQTFIMMTDAATLKDSINMTEWFKEAEMTAKKEPFPVKK
ncbi:MAG: hypothetical protein ACLUGF_12955 [Clostridium sp.]